MEAAAKKLMDPSQPFDLALLDEVVNATYNAQSPHQQEANRVLMEIKERKDMWINAKTILEGEVSPQSKFFALQLLEDAIFMQWKALPSAEREGIRNFISNMIVSLSQSEETMNKEKVLIGKLNRVLVGILKQEWPYNWPTFIPDIVSLSMTSEIICENNMHILKLLSEEVFEFGKDSMTSAKIRTMKAGLEGEFAKIYELCDFVLGRSSRVPLLTSTLQTLQRFITWIPIEYIFKTNLLDTLTTKFLVAPNYRIEAIDCLTEVGGLVDIDTDYNTFLCTLFAGVIEQISKLLPNTLDLSLIFKNSAYEAEQAFVKKLGIFFTTFLRNNLKVVEIPQCMGILMEGLNYLVRISEVPDDEIFKICLEYYYTLSQDLYHSDFESMGRASNYTRKASHNVQKRTTAYQEILSRIRNVLIMRMSKPEEVLVVEDENGEIVRETTKDTEAIAQYKTMRETLVYLTHLNYEDTENIMLSKLSLQVDGREFSWANLNTLCWAIGSISGAMTEDEEKRFLVTVIKDLLSLCEMKRGKDNKAVIASNIMYVVGQYPRFLRAHWKFLRTVINKLFEFMHELHPGVQDMACDTFLKITSKCKKKFVTIQSGEASPFIDELLQQLPMIVADLETHQMHTFYEAVACMLSDNSPNISIDRARSLQQLMTLPNQEWRNLCEMAKLRRESILESNAIRMVSRILRTNVRVCSAAGSIYSAQLNIFFFDMLNIYKLYSEQINLAIAQNGEMATRLSQVRAMRGAKKEVLKLLTTFIESASEPEFPPKRVAEQLIPHILDFILTDYTVNIDSARDPEVLSLLSTSISNLKDFMLPYVPRVIEAVFECTLSMITKNMEDFPEHRIKFFKFLQEVNLNCFEAIFQISPTHQQLIVDAVVWAFKHTDRNIAETGLEILYELLKRVGKKPEVAQGFYKLYLISLMQDIFAVLTDMLHKSCFLHHCNLLQHMFHIILIKDVTVELWTEEQAAMLANQGIVLANNPDANCTFVGEYICNLLQQSFPLNLNRTKAMDFVSGMFQVQSDASAFKQHLRDFLISIKEFTPEESQELFFQESQASKAATDQALFEARLEVPGLVNPYERPEEDMGDL